MNVLPSRFFRKLALMLACIAAPLSAHAEFDPFSPSSGGGSEPAAGGSSSVAVPAVQAGASSPISPTDRTFTVVDAATVTEGPAVNLIFRVQLNQTSTVALKVNYSTANGTATSGSDYLTRTGTLTFAPGTISMTISVPVVNNAEPPFEPSEFMYLSISGNTPGTTIARSLGQGRINDPPSSLPKIRINNAPSVLEGNSGTRPMVFTVTLDRTSATVVTVKYATADGTAQLSKNDYVAKSGTLTFNPGQTSKTVSVTINGDTIKGVNETVFVNLNTPVNATIDDGQGVGTILNDD